MTVCFLNLCRFFFFIFIGDFRVNFTDTTHPYCNTLQSVMLCFSMFPVPHTHHSGSTSIIDLLFTSKDMLLHSIYHTCQTTIILGSWQLLIRFINRGFTSKGRRIWRYTFADWVGASEAIDEFDWDTVMTENIDDTWEKWLQQFMSIRSHFSYLIVPYEAKVTCNGS